MDTLDAVDGIEVLDQDNLEARGGSLARGNGGNGQEVLPDAVPADPVLGDNLLLVADPVAVPPPQSGRVVDADCVDALDFETGAFKLVDDPAQRRGGVGTGEDVLVHEETPGQILKLPGLAETGDLEEKDTVVVEHVVDLTCEAAEVTDTDVFGHFQAGDFVVAALGDGDVAVVHAENSGLVLGDASLAEAIVTPGSLVAAESDTSDVSTVLDRGKLGQGAPATANVEHPLALLDVNLLADNGQLVVLELLERLLLVDVGNDARSVNHTRAEEPAVEVVTAVVVVTDLLLV